MEYWLFHLFLLVLIVGSIVVGGALAQAIGSGANADFSFSIVSIVFLGSIIPHLAVTVRRFHDQGLSGWHYLWTFFPYIGGLISIYFMVQPGSWGENNWGDDPLQNGIDTDVFS